MGERPHHTRRQRQHPHSDDDVELPDLSHLADGPMTPYAPGAFLRLRAEAPGARGARIALRIIIIPCIAIFVGGLLYAFVSALLHQ